MPYRSRETNILHKFLNSIDEIPIQSPEGRDINGLNSPSLVSPEGFEDRKQRGFGLPGASRSYDEDARSLPNLIEGFRLHFIQAPNADFVQEEPNGILISWVESSQD